MKKLAPILKVPPGVFLHDPTHYLFDIRKINMSVLRVKSVYVFKRPPTTQLALYNHRTKKSKIMTYENFTAKTNVEEDPYLKPNLKSI